MGDANGANSQLTLLGVPQIRRDLIKRHLYLIPNSIVVSRGCPHTCDFCSKEAFFKGGKSFYTQAVNEALAEIERLPGHHLYFLDDHLLGKANFATDLFVGMKGMGRVWQAASTIQAILQPGLVEKAVASGLRSLFVGFETFNQTESTRTAQVSKSQSRLQCGHRSSARLGGDDQCQLR